MVDDRLVDRVLDEAVEPVVAALRRRGIDYRGVLYAGLILTADGPQVLEYNVRFGDPETQVVLPRLDEDLTALLAEAAAGHLRTEPRTAPGAAVCVVLAAAGYPEDPRAGDVIDGVDVAGTLEGVTVLHAGTALDAEGNLVTAGGRVLGVTATGATLAVARDRAYAGVGRIGWPGMQHRTDIAARAALDEGGGAQRRGGPMIPRYSLPEMQALFTDEARLAGVARGGDPGRRGLGVGGGDPRPRRRRRAGARAQGDARARGRRRRPGEGHRPRRGRLRRRRPGCHRPPGGVVGPLRAHLVRRGGHRAVRHLDARRRPAARRL